MVKIIMGVMIYLHRHWEPQNMAVGYMVKESITRIDNFFIVWLIVQCKILCKHLKHDKLSLKLAF